MNESVLDSPWEVPDHQGSTADRDNPGDHPDIAFEGGARPTNTP